MKHLAARSLSGVGLKGNQKHTSHFAGQPISRHSNIIPQLVSIQDTLPKCTCTKKKHGRSPPEPSWGLDFHFFFWTKDPLAHFASDATNDFFPCLNPIFNLEDLAGLFAKAKELLDGLNRIASLGQKMHEPRTNCILSQRTPNKLGLPPGSFGDLYGLPGNGIAHLHSELLQIATPKKLNLSPLPNPTFGENTSHTRNTKNTKRCETKPSSNAKRPAPRPVAGRPGLPEEHLRGSLRKPGPRGPGPGPGIRRALGPRVHLPNSAKKKLKHNAK